MTEGRVQPRSTYPVVFRNGTDCYLCANEQPCYILTTAVLNDVALCAACVAWWRDESGEPIAGVRPLTDGVSRHAAPSD